ncbi:hypothetical protein F0562_035022 [Nyssa sinensis]|uniref:A20-type domain-containing protein n=1 Tax=Nyssa sinensis TaxID=561372 RepID=A0A5J5AD17_9ASTE|nr:hypothetical protein F0562_035022 [Nyssa sinensis]
MEHDETGCQPPPEGPILCINNCGFFGSAATMNMCSKCHKDLVLKQEQAKLAASSIENIVNGSSSGSGKQPVIAGTVDVPVSLVEARAIALSPSYASGSVEIGEAKAKEGPNRCSSCKKRVGLTGFKCRCEWNLINAHGRGDVPKVADFLGVSKSENQSDLVAYNEIQANDTDYPFSTNSLPLVQNTLATPPNNYDFQENASNLQTLTLSMGSGNGTPCETSGDSNANVGAAPRRTLDTFGQRTSIYRGVTRHRWTGRYEAHLWDNSCRREGQSRKGRQVYLGE